MAHEMVHAYDHLRFKLDWDSDLRHAACTEVILFLIFCLSVIRRKVNVLTLLPRYAQVLSAASVDGLENFSDEVNGNSRNNTRNAFEEGRFSPYGQDRSAKMKHMPKRS